MSLLNESSSLKGLHAVHHRIGNILVLNTSNFNIQAFVSWTEEVPLSNTHPDPATDH